MKCIVCKTEGAKYRCRPCQSAYCSSACFKVHRADLPSDPSSDDTAKNCHAILTAQAPARAAAAEKATTEALQDPFSDVSLAAATRAAPSPTTEQSSSANETAETNTGERKRSRDGDDPTGWTPGVEDAPPLQAARGEREGQEGSAVAVSSSAHVAEEEGLTILSEKHLRALANAKSIRSALKDDALQTLLKTIDRSRSRLDALEAALYNNPDFKAFCEEVKATIALAEFSSNA